MEERKKELLKERINASLDKYDARIRELEAKGKMVSADARSALEDTMGTLRQKREELKEQSESIISAGAEGLQDLKTRFKKASKEMKKGIKAASRQLKKSK